MSARSFASFMFSPAMRGACGVAVGGSLRASAACSAFNLGSAGARAVAPALSAMAGMLPRMSAAMPMPSAPSFASSGLGGMGAMGGAAGAGAPMGAGAVVEAGEAGEASAATVSGGASDGTASPLKARRRRRKL